MQTRDLAIAASLFGGLQAIIVAIIANAALSFGQSYLKLRRDYAVVAFAAIMFIFGVSPILVILAAAFFGLIIYRDQSFQLRQMASMGTLRTNKSVPIIFFAAAIGFLILYVLHHDLFDLSAY